MLVADLQQLSFSTPYSANELIKRVRNLLFCSLPFSSSFALKFIQCVTHHLDALHLIVQIHPLNFYLFTYDFHTAFQILNLVFLMLRKAFQTHQLIATLQADETNLFVGVYFAILTVLISLCRSIALRKEILGR
jgi:hypothetical protein